MSIPKSSSMKNVNIHIGPPNKKSVSDPPKSRKRNNQLGNQVDQPPASQPGSSQIVSTLVSSNKSSPSSESYPRNGKRGSADTITTSESPASASESGKRGSTGSTRDSTDSNKSLPHESPPKRHKSNLKGWSLIPLPAYPVGFPQGSSTKPKTICTWSPQSALIFLGIINFIMILVCLGNSISNIVAIDAISKRQSESEDDDDGLNADDGFQDDNKNPPMPINEPSNYLQLRPFYLARSVSCAFLAISTILLLFGIGMKSIYLCAQYILVQWVVVFVEAMFYINFFSFLDTTMRVLGVVFIIIGIYLRLMESYAVHLFLKKIPDNQEQDGQVHPPGEQYQPDHDASNPPVYFPALGY